MNKLFAGAAAFLLSGAFAQAPATTPGPDPSDPILVAYQLTADEKTAFVSSMAGGTIAPFWNTDWANRDYIDMNTANNSYPGKNNWSGPTDAEITVHAAVDKYGLYLHFTVEDNVFVDSDPSNTNNWIFDACDFCIDLLSANQILNAGPDVLFHYADYGWAITTTTQQFQVWMGAATPSGQMCYNFFSPDFFDWLDNTVNVADMPSQYNGIEIEVVNIDQTHKGQQWYIPWTALGTTGLQAGDTLASRQFAFAGGYNDVDASTATAADVKCLRWLKADPFGPQPPAVATNAALSSWGNIQVADEMTDVVASDDAIRSRLPHAMAVNVVKTELYNLKGERIPMEAKITRNTILLQRTTLSNGKIQVSKVHY